jgi:hypothetical protein
MLIKNEEAHLERTLPRWAKIIGMITPTVTIIPAMSLFSVCWLTVNNVK